MISPSVVGWVGLVDLPAFAIAAARMAPVALLTPALGARSIWARAVAALLLSAMVWPAIRSMGVPDLGGTALLRELIIGLSLGFVAAIPFFAAQAAGRLASAQLRITGTILEDGYALFALALFATFSGPSLLVAGLRESYVAFPLGASSPGSLQLLSSASARLIESAIVIAAPVLASLLVVDLVRALIERAQPLFERAAETSALRLVVGFTVMALALRAFAPALSLTGFTTPRATLQSALKALQRE